MRKKWIRYSVALAVLLLLFSLSCIAHAGNTTEFMDGSGTAADPYLISNQTHLSNVRNYPSAHFLLLRDLTVDDMGLTTFSGVFDGGGRTLSGLNTSFVTTLRGEIRDLTLEGTVSGGLFAQTVEAVGSVTGCRSAGTVTGATAGGIAAVNKGTITLCSNEASVTATQYAGGICGQGQDGTVERSYNIGQVTATGTTSLAGYAGGIVGYQSTVIDCFNIGYVCSDDYAGGLAGYSTAVTRSYNAGRLSSTNVGGIIGQGQYVLNGGADVTDCYWLDNVSWYLGYGMNAENTHTCCTLEELAEQSTYRTFDFDAVWQMDEGSFGLPVLRGNPMKGFSTPNTVFAGGSGVFYDPYLIETEAQLKNISLYPDRHFLLTADITLARVNWTPLCSGGFTGVFDGGEHTISGLYHSFSQSSSSGTSLSVGLFAKNSGIIRDLTLENVYLNVQRSGQSVKCILGAFAAESTEYGLFENCHVASGTIDAKTYYTTNWGGVAGSVAGEASAGGICGIGEGTFIGCSNAASITTYSRAGGIAAAGKTFQNCSNSGAVTVNGQKTTDSFYGLTAGGIVGYCTGDLQDCSNSGAVASYNKTDADRKYPYAGGIFGRSSGAVTGCRNSGTIQANSIWSSKSRGGPIPYAGGIGADAAGKVTCCINQGMVTSVGGYASKYETTQGYVSAYAGGIVGYGTTISDCVNQATAECSNSYYYELTNYYYLGGIAGYATKISTSYNATEGDMLSLSDPVGSLEETYHFYRGSIAGQVTTISNCYFQTNFTSLYPAGRTDAQLRLQETYQGFDFTGIWGFDLFSDYAYAVPQDFIAPAAEITLAGDPAVEVLEGMSPDYSALSVTVKNGAGESRTVPVQSWMVQAVNTSVPGTVELSVTYGGLRAETPITLTIRAKSPLSLAVKTLPAKTTYREAETLDLSGGVFTVSYDNLTEADLAMTEAVITGFDSTVPGRKTLTLSYDGLTAAFSVTVITPLGISVKYMPYYVNRDIVGVAPDPIGLTVELVYSDGSGEEIPEEELTLRYDFSTVGKSDVIVCWNGMTTSYETTVWEGKPTYAELVYEPSKLSYWPGESLDFTGSLVEICYEVDEPTTYFTRWIQTELTTEMVTGYDPNRSGLQTLQVTCGGLTDDFLVQVRSAPLITSTAAESTEEGLAVTVEIHEDAREYTFLLVGYRQGRMIACGIVTQPVDTQISRTFAGLKAGDAVRVFVLESGYRPMIPAADVAY